MKLQGKTYKANIVTIEKIVEKKDHGESFVKDLEWCLIKLCRDMDVPIPLWLDKNTSEFARFRQTIFFEDHFTEKVLFDRFQIKLLE